MNMYREAQDFVSKVTRTTEQERRHRDTQACERRLAQMAAKRAKELKRQEQR